MIFFSLKHLQFVLFGSILLVSGCTENKKPTSKIRTNDIDQSKALSSTVSTNDSILEFKLDLNRQEVKLYWKDSTGTPYFNFANLKRHIEGEGKELLFAMNGGIFTREHKPLGLYIEDGKVLHRINKVQEAYGNFYLQPNGIFYITKDKKALVIPTKDFVMSDSIDYATQSGPMLVIDGQIHPKFNETSKNLNIRNGVGILPDGNIIFAMSKKRVNLYDFADYFKKAGCKNALYLDGAISKTFYPSKGYTKTNGTFIVLIGVTQ